MIGRPQALRLKELLEQTSIPFEFIEDIYGGNYRFFDERDWRSKPSYHINVYKKDGKKLCELHQYVGTFEYRENFVLLFGCLTESELPTFRSCRDVSADEAFKRIKYCYENNTDIYKDKY